MFPKAKDCAVCYTGSKLSPDREKELEKLVLSLLPKNEGEHIMQSVLDSYVAEGKAENSIEVARAMLNRNKPLDEIEEFSGLSLDEIRKLQTRH